MITRILRIKKKVPLPQEVFLKHPKIRPFTKDDVRKCSKAIITMPGSKDPFIFQGDIVRKSQQTITVKSPLAGIDVTYNVPYNSPYIHVQLLREQILTQLEDKTKKRR
ncbi:hypothetical protein AKO1_012496 [Acrasis kona]|uniref:Ribosomal protein S10 n=1 Tax=Acrasis kona TaxID=1008807 RepID=A0AAW2YY32_9EUKA